MTHLWEYAHVTRLVIKQVPTNVTLYAEIEAQTTWSISYIIHGPEGTTLTEPTVYQAVEPNYAQTFVVFMNSMGQKGWQYMKDGGANTFQSHDNEAKVKAFSTEEYSWFTRPVQSPAPA
ncbi:hypothetical protein ACIOD2_27320 [Amycolatopsis sp. NPDC088138]|uniref:hypothetical protein n=1 Tax=Amycolatopsis sp. NPDC088138 TaxID=3363938 RepID=UPI00381A288B